METKSVQIDQAVEGSGNIFSATGDVNVVQHIRPAEFADRRNLYILREKVKHFWIDTVLEQSLHQVAALELGKVIEQDSVEHPWDLIVEHRGHADKTISGQESIGTLFEVLDRAILILGAPGSGKTITLLELAQDRINLAESDPAQPIPVIFGLSTWTPQQGTLLEWLISEMANKYSVNRKLSKSWIENQWILPLLDGLDEVREKYRLQCLNAINSFTKEVGVAGIAVCCRQAEYIRLSDRLYANGAIFLQPLTNDQIERYLLTRESSLNYLQTALKNDVNLRSLASTPLMLNIICLAHANSTEIKQYSLEAGSDSNLRSLLFDTYINRMFERRGKKIKAPYSRERIMSVLSFLAKGMAHHSQNDFYAESLQPSWLTSNRARWAYLIIAHIISGIVSIVLLFPHIYISRSPNISLSYHFFLFSLAVITVMFGGIYAGALRFRLTRGIIIFNKSGLFWSILINIAVCWLLGITLIGPVLTSIPYNELNKILYGWAYGLFLGLFWGLWGRKRTINSDIKSFEELHWSRRRAKYGGLICAGIWLIYSVWYWNTFGWTNLDVEITLDWQFVFQYLLAYLIVLFLISSVGILYGGLSIRKAISHKTTFNQGMHQTFRRVILIMVVFIFFGLLFAFLAWFTFTVVAPEEIRSAAFNWKERLKEGLRFGSLLAFFAVFLFGGHDLIQHSVLRFLLSLSGKIPIRCGNFFRDATKLIFLRHVGGGFRFIHQSLRDHFSSMQIEANFSITKPQINRRYRLINFAKLSCIISIYTLVVIYNTNPVIRYRIAALIGDNNAIFALGEYYETQKSNTNLEAAFFWYQKAAEDGNTDAQMKVGYAYMLGHGVRQDYQKAFKWYGLAAEQGIAHAQFALGILYHNGWVASSNVNIAEEWYRRAADQGHVKAQMRLAEMYSKAGQFPYNAEESMKWYHAAAENGLSEAQYALGLIYHTDEHFLDYSEAEKWYRLADAQGNENASGSLGWLLIETERWDEAKFFTQKAHDADPQNWAWIGNLGNLALLNGKKAEAKAFYLKALPLIVSKEDFQNGPLSDMDLFIERNWQPDLCHEMKQFMLNNWQQIKK